MTDLPTPEPDASPCLAVCRVNGRSGYCEGCFRTLKEIAGWGGMSLEERREVLAALPEREAQFGDAALLEKARARRQAYRHTRTES